MLERFGRIGEVEAPVRLGDTLHSTLASSLNLLMLYAWFPSLAMVVARSLPLSSGEEAAAGVPLLFSVNKPGISQGSGYAFL